MLDREQRVREIAHRLWEEEGRPTAQEKRSAFDVVDGARSGRRIAVR